MSEQKESSVLFSLKELMNLEEDRIKNEEAEKAVIKLEEILPKQMFVTKIQGKAGGRILASRTKAALKKTVTAHLSGGDISRKKKLWNIQKEGKKRMMERGQGDINIPQEVFVKMMRMGE